MDSVIRRSPRLLPVLALLVAVFVALTSPAAVGAAAATPAAVVAGSTSDTTPATLESGEDATACISALPKPGCDQRDTDAMQVAVLLVMTAGLGVIGWRIARAVRARDRTSTPPTGST
jgi:hypothetical protein